LLNSDRRADQKPEPIEIAQLLGGGFWAGVAGLKEEPIDIAKVLGMDALWHL